MKIMVTNEQVEAAVEAYITCKSSEIRCAMRAALEVAEQIKIQPAEKATDIELVERLREDARGGYGYHELSDEAADEIERLRAALAAALAPALDTEVDWRPAQPAGAPTYEELHSRSPEAYAQGFEAGIEAAAQAGRGVIEKHVVFKYVLDAFDDAIRALRPAEQAGASVFLSSNEGLENWQQGFTAGIEAVKKVLNDYLDFDNHPAYVDVAATIRALRPAAQAGDVANG